MGLTRFGSAGGGAAWGAITGTLSDQADLQALLQRMPVLLRSDELTVLTSGAGGGVSIGTVEIPSWCTRFHLGSNTGSDNPSSVLAETAAGDMSGATIRTRLDTASGTQILADRTMPASTTGRLNLSPATGTSVFLRPTSGLIHFQQNSNAANAGTVRFFVWLWPLL